MTVVMMNNEFPFIYLQKRLLWSEMPFYEEFSRYEGVKKIIRIMVRLTKMEPTVVVKSIVEEDPEQKARVDFMVQHIQFMETINSNVFDREILKKAKPAEDTFVLPENSAEKELLHEIFRCLQTVTQGPLLRVIYDVRSKVTILQVFTLTFPHFFLVLQ